MASETYELHLSMGIMVQKLVDMASGMLLHTSFLLDTTFCFLSNISKGMLPNRGGYGYNMLHIGRIEFTLSNIFIEDFHLEIPKESLLNVIHDIDAAFCKVGGKASTYNFNSGSTALVILVADSHILAANIGDSKAFLCSNMFQSPPKAKG
ncbi:putative PPM-type phosphatase domain, protein phosphatase 2C family [Helianthus annuus]|uniref:PPM-type phosphatase domain, protein phosphatase 2C family n=1 Tax=Helianthus annuus TaxID=4232 RepID=A0A9K3HQU7_HELAN|nr:putative PPM-type phosphatase domain, protein phosphatase 2C family [Helianthus annuus]KAJ0875824.1 putative PPM-type phosphatase domain, protein phosphatase 2C family [Helianthus annuus]